ncbi:hypothetical protein ABB37_06446 [Leptomonas pyrrhocoris]|uniref:Uncharacterized protein n=1 Tax=Leptomonas pyrrhocoris TaxID=157538 RepID=A0A0M9FY45_LEPPY|nr:hypothetical protein ABB37_06446 [Leptomonas pyrrhocoris]KPA78309.1 hypothetical protein ABB37_06446 [Leptomonas pyrrhocoris]|eukprot:XP_015656748.1 hypothetical protein ABB37_06446 [Leptomonas pyrrhocoris]
MSAHRLGVSAHSDEQQQQQQQQPKRNLAAGKRLAPLPPGLRSRVRGTPSDAAAAHSPPPPRTQQRSSSQTRFNEKDGRRHLPPVSRGGPSSSSFSSSAPAAAFASTAPPARDGRRSAPPTAADAAAGHSHRASNTSVSCSGGGGGGASAAAAAAAAPSSSSSSCAPPTAPRASTSEGMRRPSPSKAAASVNVTTHGANRSTLAHGGATAAAASARVERPTPRAPVLSRASARAPPREESTTGATPTNTASAGGQALQEPHGATPPAHHAAPPQPAAEVKVHFSAPGFPPAPHDMETRFYTDKSEWCDESELPPLVWSLLDGTSLEAPHTSYLWTQAYPQPGELLPPPPLPNTKPLYHERREDNASDTPEPLPLPLQHRDSEKRRGGFYACVRCATPICSPHFQVVPAAPALRGIAVFSRLHLNAVDLRVRAAGGDTTRAQRPSFSSASYHTPLRSGGGALTSMSEADALLQAAGGGMRFLVHCHHCGGCLGAMFIGEITAPPSASPPTPTAARELLCVNSVCLRYMRYRTRAPLDGELLGRSSGTTAAAAAASTASTTTGVTMGALFGSPRYTAWNLQGRVDGAEDAADDDSERGGDASSFAELLESLNPYSGKGDDDSD